MTAISALGNRVIAEVNDSTNNTLSASITGTNFTEIQQYLVDGISEYRKYVFREVFDSSVITSANTRGYVVSALSPAPYILKRVEYVQTSTAIHNIPDVELFNGTMYTFDGDRPLFQEANKYFNLWYYAKHDLPSASSAQVTLPQEDEEIPINYAKSKVMKKQALDQRGINQDTTAEFLNMAESFEKSFRDGIKRNATVFTSYKG